MDKGRLSIYGKRKMKKALSVVVSLSLYKTNIFHVAVRLFSNRSPKTSKCGKNTSDTWLSPRVPLFCSYHILTSSADARQHGMYLLYIYIYIFSIYALSDLGDLSNLVSSLFNNIHLLASG